MSDKTPRCNLHEHEIKQIKKDLNHLKEDVNDKIDELMREVRKPILTDRQWSKIVVGAIIYVIGVVLFIGNTKSMAQENAKDILEINKDYDKILEYLIEIKEDVAKQK